MKSEAENKAIRGGLCVCDICDQKTKKKNAPKCDLSEWLLGKGLSLGDAWAGRAVLCGLSSQGTDQLNLTFRYIMRDHARLPIYFARTRPYYDEAK